MTFNRTLTAIAVIVSAGLAGCEDGEVSGIVIADLSGEWDASVLTFTPASSSSESNPIPFVALGGDLVVEIENSGAFSGVLTVPGAVTGGDPLPLDVAGTMSLGTDDDDEDIIIVDFDTQTEGRFAAVGLPFEDFDGPFSLSGNQLTITNETDFDFDLGGPGEAEAAVLTLVLARVST